MGWAFGSHLAGGRNVALDDGVSFVHVAIEHDVEHPDSLQDVPAFRAFVSDVDSRCDVAPVAMSATVVGGYG